MKKLFKIAAGVATIAGAVCGAVYCLKKFCGIDLLKRDKDFDDFDEEFDEDFDDDSDDESEDNDEAQDAEPSNDDEAEDREYVTLDMESEEASDDSEKASEDDEKSDE